jgi:hypothetical protein
MMEYWMVTTKRKYEEETILIEGDLVEFMSYVAKHKIVLLFAKEITKEQFDKFEKTFDGE